MGLRVLVVDDTVTFRKILSETLAEIPGVEVVGVAHHGKMAISRIQSLRPDLITLDIEMPEMNGLDVLGVIRDQKLDVGVIMVSVFTQRGSEMTIRALELGAFDFITKSTGEDYASSRESIRKALTPLVKAYAQRLEIRSILRPSQAPPVERVSATAPPQQTPASQRTTIEVSSAPIPPTSPALKGKSGPDMVLIGVSTGGPNALAKVIPVLPAGLGVPVFVVQHMPPMFTQSLAESLNKQSSLQVKEAEPNEISKPDTVYIAPGGKHMKLSPGQGGNPLILITDEPPENNCKPSVDTLFRSVALHFPGRACAVIMTGMGNDGTTGLRLLKRHTTRVIAQDESSCVVFGMPKEAIAAGVVDVISPLDNIAEEIYKTIKGTFLPLSRNADR